jgi:hypothetical protein
MTFKPGTVLSVSRGLYRHVGIASNFLVEGEQGVISASSKFGHVVEQTLSEFADGGSVRNDGYPGTLPPAVVLMRARRCLGQRYNLLFSNCEHFARHAHGLRVASPQLIIAAWAAIVIGVVVFAGRTKPAA